LLAEQSAYGCAVEGAATTTTESTSASAAELPSLLAESTNTTAGTSWTSRTLPAWAESARGLCQAGKSAWLAETTCRKALANRALQQERIGGGATAG
jgi:hypothetical protein